MTNQKAFTGTTDLLERLSDMNIKRINLALCAAIMLWATGVRASDIIDMDKVIDEMENRQWRYNGKSSDSEHLLPTIATPGVGAIGVEEEKAYGEFFIRKARGGLPIILDPVLDEYIGTVGSRLLSHANGVRFPFRFFLIKDQTLNAAAFLGGNVKVNTGLFAHADNESQFAGVLAHEISHVTRRHIASAIEAASSRIGKTISGIIGSIILAMINPTAGMTALYTTLGLNIQAGINYTRKDEADADKIGAELLYRAGYDPMQMAEFFRKLSNPAMNKIPQGLLDHPVAESRVAATMNAAEALGKPKVTDFRDFCLAKARIAARFEGRTPQQAREFFGGYLAGHKGVWSESCLKYGLALAYLDSKNAAKALDILNSLPENIKNSLFWSDAVSDAWLLSGNGQKAITYLTEKKKLYPDSETIVVNLANVYQSLGRNKEAIKILEPYSRIHRDSLSALMMLADCYAKQGMGYERYKTMAEFSSLKGDWDNAAKYIYKAATFATTRLQKATLDAMIIENEHWRTAEKRFED